MTDKVLLIDDDANLLSGLSRHFADDFDLVTATSGADGIARVKESQAAKAPFPVVVCDQRMPGMDGVETLRQIKDLAPDTVRIMLTGNADQQTAIQAINQGHIFRFFTKPCPLDQLRGGIEAAIDQYRLITAERDLLEKTLAGSLRMLVDIASLNDPVGHQHASRVREWARAILAHHKMPPRWQLEVAAILLGIGSVTLPPEIVAKLHGRETLSEVEKQIVERVPEAARNLVGNIPRLEKVAEILYLQDRGFDGSGFPANGPAGEGIPFEARLLKILKDLSIATDTGPLTRAAFDMLMQKRERYDMQVLGWARVALEPLTSLSTTRVVEVPVAALRAGQELMCNLVLTNGRLILAAHTQLSPLQIERIRNMRKMFTFVEPVQVRV